MEKNTNHMTGIELIAQERKEQIEKHGRTIAQDKQHNRRNELILGTIALLEDKEDLFPFKWDRIVCRHMFLKGRVEQLAIAGALIAAEIDRIQS